MRNGENAGYQHFLLFPQCFPRVISTGPLTYCIYFERFRSRFTKLNDQNLLQIVIFKMAQNRNNETEGKVEEEEERGQETSDQMEQLFVRERDKEKEIRERTSVQFQEHFVSVREKKSSKCESCVSEG